MGLAVTDCVEAIAAAVAMACAMFEVSGLLLSTDAFAVCWFAAVAICGIGNG